MNKKIRAFSIVVILTIVLLSAKIFANQHFSSIEEFQIYIQSFGTSAPVVLTLFQALQVIIPVLPGYFGCVVGAVSFGTLTGFICNYIGISAGSIASYFLARKYGVSIVQMMFSEKTFQKWEHKIEQQSSYQKFLFIATLLPLFPDDLLCYFSGLIKMNIHKFIWIIIFGKPWCILMYSIIFGMIK